MRSGLLRRTNLLGRIVLGIVLLVGRRGCSVWLSLDRCFWRVRLVLRGLSVALLRWIERSFVGLCRLLILVRLRRGVRRCRYKGLVLPS